MSTTIDTVDHGILDLLVENARRSATDIGRLVGLSQAAVSRRIDRLEADGYILRYAAILDHVRLGGPLEAFTELRFAPGTQVGDIDDAVGHVPEVVEAFTLAGEPDALVRVRVEGVEQLKGVIDSIRRGRRGGARITGTKTSIVLGSRRSI